MATNQVVNLLHLRSLSFGEIPVNLSFGQFAINVFSVENPVLNELRDASLFIGTGGNERVDEDGTDRSADAFLASALTGEPVALNQGWVRYSLRKVKATGDIMVGDLTMTGASIRFQTGPLGEAQLVLPTELVSVTGEAGALRFDTVSQTVQFHDGTGWSAISSALTFQVAALAPGSRVDGTSLVDGDRWWNTNLNIGYSYVGGGWEVESDGADSQISTATPTTRSNGGPLEVGDIYFNPIIDTHFTYDGVGWQKVIGSPGEYQTGAVAPTTRASGDPLVPGDQWFDTVVGILKLWDGFTWFDVVQSPNFQVAAAAPTTRSTGGGLVAGDTYLDTTLSAYFVWDGTAWVATDTFRDYQSSATAPTLRSDATSALVAGDFWYDTTRNYMLFWDGGAWVAVSSQDYDFQTRTGAAPTLRDNGVDALKKGDWWYDTSATVPFLYFWDGAQWINSTDGGTF